MEFNFKGQMLSLLGNSETEEKLKRNIEQAIREGNPETALKFVAYYGRDYEVEYDSAELKKRMTARGLWAKVLNAIEKAKELPQNAEITFIW